MNVHLKKSWALGSLVLSLLIMASNVVAEVLPQPPQVQHMIPISESCEHDKAMVREVDIREFNLLPLLDHIMMVTLSEKAPSQALMNCYARLQAGATTLPLTDLVQIMPELLDHVGIRAARPDAPLATINGAISGCNTCDLTQVIQLLGVIKSILIKCCEDIEINFQGTFTVLANLTLTATVDFNPVFTVLVDIKNTLTTCCENIEINFEGTFTSLVDIKNTLTACCAANQINFNGTFTVLEDIRITLTTCCENIEINFEGTFTSLVDIKNTLTACCAANQINFNGTFTVLEDIRITLTTCCENIEINFEGTFTSLVDIKNTLTACCGSNQINFNGTFTVLEDIRITLTTCCDNIEINFNGTFTVLEDIRTTLTTCCENIEINFEGTFTVLEDIRSTLTTCCENIQANFEGTFTVLANLTVTATVDLSAVFTVLANLTVTATVDLSPVFTVLEDIRTTLTTCCENIEINFEGTFTVLEDIKNTLTVCCDNIEINFEGTFTVLDDIRSTLTACCADILDTLTQLGCDGVTQINSLPFTITQPGKYCVNANNMTGTITIAASNVVLDLNSNTVNGTSPAITSVGQSDIIIKNGIVANGTSGILLTSCENVVIAGIDFIDNASGLLVVTTTALNVEACTFRGHTANPISLTDVNNVHIGEVAMFDSAVPGPIFLITSGNNVRLTNINLNNNTSASGLDLVSSNNISITNCTVNNNNLTLGLGCSLSNDITILNSNINRNSISGPPSPFMGLSMNTVNKLFIENLLVQNNQNNSSGPATLTGVQVVTVNDATIIRAYVNENSSTAAAGCSGIQIVTSNRIILQECTANANTAGTTMIGIDLDTVNDATIIASQASGNTTSGGDCTGFNLPTSNHIVLRECSATGNTGSTHAIGFNMVGVGDIAGFDILYDHCISNSQFSITGTALGFESSLGTKSMYDTCIANDNTGAVLGAGFFINGELSSSILNCIAKRNTGFSFAGVGIFLQDCTDCFVQNNVTISNSVAGIVVFSGISATLDNTIFGNRSQGHGTSPTGNSNYAINPGDIFTVLYTRSTVMASATPTDLDNISII